MSIIRRVLAQKEGASFVPSVQVGRHPPLPTFAISTYVESSKFLSAISPPPRLVKYGANLRQKFPPESPLAPLCAELPTCASLSVEQPDPSSVKPLSRFSELFLDFTRTSTKIAPELQVKLPQSIVTLFTGVSSTPGSHHPRQRPPTGRSAWSLPPSRKMLGPRLRVPPAVWRPTLD